MPAAAFNAGDFRVFDVKGFQPRMTEIRGRIRPKLEALGHSLAPGVSRATGGPSFVHVAKHARRTVNAPDDTWVAFGPDTRNTSKPAARPLATPASESSTTRILCTASFMALESADRRHVPARKARRFCQSSDP